jgi:hypothetical protein
MKLKADSTSTTSEQFLLKLHTVTPMCMFLYWSECWTFKKEQVGKKPVKTNNKFPLERDIYHKLNKETEKN